jgi:hypothetical protein
MVESSLKVKLLVGTSHFTIPRHDAILSYAPWMFPQTPCCCYCGKGIRLYRIEALFSDKVFLSVLSIFIS